MTSRARTFLEEENYKEALYACRADLTQYTIWHKSHTEPMMRFGIPNTKSLYGIDLRALSEIVDTLFLCHTKANMMDDFPAVLERLRGNIKGTEWQRKIVYFHAVHALGTNWDKSAGRRELKKLGSIADDNDIEMLQLYLDLYWDDLSFSARQDLIDRILKLSKKLSDRLHYKGTKAFLYLTIGDHGKAEDELCEVIAEVEAKNGVEDLNEHVRYRYALALDLLGALRQDDSLLMQALGLYQTLLKEIHWTPSGHANILSKIGEIYCHKNEWENAHSFYMQALEINPAEIHKVFLCECLLQMDEIEEASKTLSDVKLDDMTNEEELDYVFALAALAIVTEDRECLENAKTALQAAQVQEPYFRERRNHFLLNVQESLAAGTSETLVRKTRRLVASLFSRSTISYLILQPNIMGIGIDLGKIFEDLSKGSDVHAQNQEGKSNSS